MERELKRLIWASRQASSWTEESIVALIQKLSPEEVELLVAVIQLGDTRTVSPNPSNRDALSFYGASGKPVWNPS